MENKIEFSNANVPDNKKEYKPEIQLQSSERMIKEKIEFIHEKYKPEAYFVTQTSGVLLGWIVKEIYKTAWPSEAMPKFFTIDVRGPMGHSNINPDENEDLYNSRKKEYRELAAKIDKEITELKNNKDTIFDRVERLNCLESTKKQWLEMSQDSKVSYNFTKDSPEETWPETQDIKNIVLKIIKKYKIKGNITVIDESHGFGDYLDKDWTILIENYKKYAYDYLGGRRGRFRPGPEGSVSRTLNVACEIIKKAIADCGTDSLVVGMGLEDRDRSYRGPWERTDNNDGVGYRRVQTQEKKEQAKKRIDQSKETGKKIGELIKKELDLKNSPK